MLATPTPIGDLERLLAGDGAPTTSRASHRTVSRDTPIVELRLQPQKDESDNSLLLPSLSTAASSSSSSSAAGSLVDAASAVSRVCGGCQRQVAKYTCPRCNVASCSLGCYRSHSASCTRSFTEDAVRTERDIDAALKAGLGRTRAVLGREYEQTQRARKQTADLLGRLADFNAQNDAAADEALTGPNGSNEPEATPIESTMAPASDSAKADAEDPHTQERLLSALSLLDKLESSSVTTGVSNDDLLSLQSLLPPSVLQDFHRSIADGRMSQWITRWQAWWRPGAGIEIEESASRVAMHTEQDLTPSTWSIPSVRIVMDEETLPATAPLMPNEIPAFSSLFTGVPSPVLPLHVIELLYAYAYALLLHNGEEADPSELVAAMCELSPTMRGVSTSAPATTSSAASTASVAAAAATAPSVAAVPSFAPSHDLTGALVGTVSAIIECAAANARLSTSCCWSLARLGDTSQLLREKGLVLRALGHLQTIVDRAARARKQEAKRSEARGRSVAAAPTATTAPLAAISRKLRFMQSFVRDVWQEGDMRAWNRVLYAQWDERWTQHVDQHREQAEMESKKNRKK